MTRVRRQCACLPSRYWSSGIPGDAAELGVFRGEFAALINAALPERRLHLFDTFEGFHAEDVEEERRLGLSRARPGTLRIRMWKRSCAACRIRSAPSYTQGASLRPLSRAWNSAFPSSRWMQTSMHPLQPPLPLFWERLSPGGALLVHDVNGFQYAGAGRAVREFCAERGVFPTPLCDMHGSVLLRKH